MERLVGRSPSAGQTSTDSSARPKGRPLPLGAPLRPRPRLGDVPLRRAAPEDVPGVPPSLGTTLRGPTPTTFKDSSCKSDWTGTPEPPRLGVDKVVYEGAVESDGPEGSRGQNEEK